MSASSTPDIATPSALTALEGTLSQDGILSIVSWTRTSGTLILAVTSVDTETGANPPGQTTFDFDFKLVNPSMHQDAPGIGLVFRYDSLPNSEWTNVATNYGSTSVRHGDAQSANLTHPDYPMKIREATVSSLIVQSSPYTCDTNTITVTIQTDIDL